MRTPIDLIIFDLDGTLINAYPAVSQSMNYTLKRMGVPPVDHGTIKRAVGWGDRHLLMRFVGEELSHKALRIYRKHHAGTLRKGVTFLPGARGVLRMLRKKGYRLAIASNRPTKFSWIILETLGIGDYFDMVLCGDKLKRAKPHPDILLAILKTLKRRRTQALFVGDMTIDVQTGRRARVKTVAVLTGSSTLRDLREAGPYRVISRISRLPGIIDQLNGPAGPSSERRQR